jgi:hypothetical protein
MPPRATFSTIEPGLSRAISFLPMIPLVARVSGTCTVTTSDRSSRVAMSTSSTPWFAACSSVRYGVAAEHDHLHRPRPDRDRLADLAETDDPERSPAQFPVR